MIHARSVDTSSSSQLITGKFSFNPFSFCYGDMFTDTKLSNAEEMLNEEMKPKTAHTTNEVPFVMANAPPSFSLQKTDGVLGDVAPTILAVMGLEQPKEMECRSLLIRK